LLGDLLGRNGRARLVCGGTSMQPTVRCGEEMEVAPAQGARPGEVVVLRTGAGLVTHRILCRLPAPGGALLVHAGDAQPRLCGFIREARVLARVVAPGPAARRRTPGRAAQIAFLLRAAVRRLTAVSVI